MRRLQEKKGWAWWFAVPIVKSSLALLTRRTWVDGDNIPASGGCVVVLNHISHAEPLIVARLVYDQGRLPRYLAKASLFRHPVLRFLLRALGQIPVERESRAAVGAYDAAVAAVRRGECVVVYPEGTITRDPGLWPMTGKSGAARIALATGCPVVPVGQWGAQEILAPYSKRPDLFPRKHITMKVGSPIPLGNVGSGEPGVAEVAAATDRIMDAITSLVADIRGEPAPAERFDLRRATRERRSGQDAG